MQTTDIPSKDVYGYIYKISCTLPQVTGVYIGQTITSSKARFAKHKTQAIRGNTRLYREMRKYGRENFVVQTLDTASSREQLDEKERTYIRCYDSISKGFNTLQGGQTCYPQTKKEVIHYESGTVFASIRQCAQHFNLAPSQVSSCCRMGIKQADGNHFMYHGQCAQPYQKFWFEGKNRRNRQVINLVTGQVYKSQKQASQKLGVTTSCMYAMCNNITQAPRSTVYKCCFLDDQNVEELKALHIQYGHEYRKYTSSKIVIHDQTGLAYPSVQQAAKMLKLGVSDISACCRMQRSQIKGQHFRFKNIPRQQYTQKWTMCGRRNRSVVNVVTGDVYINANQAAKQTGVPEHTVRKMCRNPEFISRETRHRFKYTDN